LCPCGSCHCPLLFSGVSGRSPEQDAQPFLRVAEGGLEKWRWLDETPKGFCPDSAYLAIHRLDIQLSPLWRLICIIQGLYSTISLLHVCCHCCRQTW
jgi:hypothetical protein